MQILVLELNTCFLGQAGSQQKTSASSRSCLNPASIFSWLLTLGWISLFLLYVPCPYGHCPRNFRADLQKWKTEHAQTLLVLFDTNIWFCYRIFIYLFEIQSLPGGACTPLATQVTGAKSFASRSPAVITYHLVICSFSFSWCIELIRGLWRQYCSSCLGALFLQKY